MIEDIKEALKEKKAVFGIRECIKNINEAEKIFLSSDARQETGNKIKNIINSAKTNVNCEMLGMGKEEISKKLSINFSCEVFSVLKGPKIPGDRKDGKKERVIRSKRNKEGRDIGDKTKK